jgi:transcriptional regulator with XRE-family HTH domain
VLANLKTTISQRGLKQVDLAQSLRIPPTVLSEIIHGRRQASASLRVRIAEALCAEESWLFSTVARIPRPASLGCSETAMASFACAGRET